MQIRKLCILVCLIMFVASAQAEYQLDNDSSILNFISVKKNKIAETHSFGQLAGAVQNTGDASITISLVSVNTNIEIRDERLRKFLFETDIFPKAVVSTKLDMNQLSTLHSGDAIILQVPLSINLHGKTKVLDARLRVVRLRDNSLLVTTVKPILLNGFDFDLADGIQKLMELAKLPSISTAVPVSFSLVFKEQ
ncbi:MAG: hypothetical protein COB62_01375 [Piscirickettsiaceae bacterium]|nr:MAG: hypothetical protein COB62_01375 [Piscirickettsiaceae bacterium]